MMIHSLSSISLMLTYSMYIFSLYNACSAFPFMLAKANSCIPVQQNSSSPMYIHTSTLQLTHLITRRCAVKRFMSAGGAHPLAVWS